MTDHEPDRELLSRLRAADPASSLPPAGPDRVAQLLEAAMPDTATRSHETRETGTHDRSPLTWLVAAAAVVLIAAAGIFGLAERDHGTTPAARPSVTQLRAIPVQGSCIVLSTRVLRVQSVAFRGSLVSLTPRTATFEVSHWYAGGPTDLVKVTLMPRGIPEMTQAGDLALHHDYLVAASDGRVTGCGYTGPAGGSLQSLYDRAFG
ncbi:MAG TPA: hypothetical protein VGK78_01835 [Nocardioides sp.]|uniref:hypothetical protein n=1 Tax=Actinomycetes TaxID=1760 RepID=UPI002CCDD5B6|nr:hypothetical protein [Flexivirga sp.]HWC23068.1 hypothetical protein [Flexivirga sp.]